VALLAVGAVAGLVLAAHGLLASGPRQGEALPERVVARVNGSEILTEDYLRLVAGLERDTREIADEKSRRHVLDRMIDEEVLVQRGLELGLAESDRRIRANVTAAMRIDSPRLRSSASSTTSTATSSPNRGECGCTSSSSASPVRRSRRQPPSGLGR
jgi:hypothetical protein